MNENSYYRQLTKPSWAPDGSVFGQVWSVLYIIIFIVNGYIIYLLLQGEINWKVALPFWINLALNAIFTPVQFGLKNNLLAMLIIYGILLTIIWSMTAIWPHARLVSVAYVPYLVWVSIATVLQTSIWWMNR